MANPQTISIVQARYNCLVSQGLSMVYCSTNKVKRFSPTKKRKNLLTQTPKKRKKNTRLPHHTHTHTHTKLSTQYDTIMQKKGAKQHHAFYFVSHPR